MKFITKTILVCLIIINVFISPIFSNSELKIKMHAEVNPFNLKTTENEWGSGSVFYLDRHKINCGAGKVLQGFHLIRPSQEKIAYEYACLASPLVLSETYISQTPWDLTAENEQSSANYLDRHNVKCKQGYGIQQFQLIRNKRKIAYKYKCVKLNGVKDCLKKISEKSFGNTKYENIYLDRQSVYVGEKRVLTEFKLNSNYDNAAVYYTYSIGSCLLSQNQKAIPSSGIIHKTINATTTPTPTRKVQTPLSTTIIAKKETPHGATSILSNNSMTSSTTTKTSPPPISTTNNTSGVTMYPLPSTSTNASPPITSTATATPTINLNHLPSTTIKTSTPAISTTNNTPGVTLYPLPSTSTNASSPTTSTTPSPTTTLKLNPLSSTRSYRTKTSNSTSTIISTLNPTASTLPPRTRHTTSNPSTLSSPVTHSNTLKHLPSTDASSNRKINGSVNNNSIILHSPSQTTSKRTSGRATEKQPLIASQRLNQSLTSYLTRNKKTNQINRKNSILKKVPTFTKKTEANDWGNGNTFYLDRHDVDCGRGKLLQGFHLTRPEETKLAYEYACIDTLAQSYKYYNKKTEWNTTNGPFSTNFLDRHNVGCKLGYALQGFKLVRKEEKKIAYSFICSKAQLTGCKSAITNETLGDNYESIYLDRQSLLLGSGRVLSQFQLISRYEDNKVYYKYSYNHCKLTPEPAQVPHINSKINPRTDQNNVQRISQPTGSRVNILNPHRINASQVPQSSATKIHIPYRPEKSISRSKSLPVFTGNNAHTVVNNLGNRIITTPSQPLNRNSNIIAQTLGSNVTTLTASHSTGAPLIVEPSLGVKYNSTKSIQTPSHILTTPSQPISTSSKTISQTPRTASSIHVNTSSKKSLLHSGINLNTSSQPIHVVSGAQSSQVNIPATGTDAQSLHPQIITNVKRNNPNVKKTNVNVIPNSTVHRVNTPQSIGTNVRDSKTVSGPVVNGVGNASNARRNYSINKTNNAATKDNFLGDLQKLLNANLNNKKTNRPTSIKDISLKIDLDMFKKNGKEFCEKYCKKNTLAPMKKCYKEGVKDCVSCDVKKKFKDTEAANLCTSTCSTVNSESVCGFYAYINTDKKIMNRNIVDKVAMKALKNYL